MIQRFIRSLRGEQEQREPPRLPDGVRVYAVGDIHGHIDLLDTLHSLIEADMARSPAASAEIIYVGDYVDRGPDSRAVLEKLIGPAPADLPRTLLRGNHEAMFLHFLADPATGAHWRKFGGIETLLSYQVDTARTYANGGFEAVAEEFAAQLPAEHLALLEGMAPSKTVGDYFFCHAGVRPGVRLEDQHERDLLWIREAFLNSTKDFGKVVVHGHTPVREPEVRHNRINVDTGAYRSGRLSCAVLEGTEQRFLTAAFAEAL